MKSNLIALTAFFILSDRAIASTTISCKTENIVSGSSSTSTFPIPIGGAFDAFNGHVLSLSPMTVVAIPANGDITKVFISIDRSSVVGDISQSTLKLSVADVSLACTQQK